MMMSFNTASGKYCCNEKTSVPRVPTISRSFNTASGKYCCNQISIIVRSVLTIIMVSIPQAVSTVATLKVVEVTPRFKVSIPQAVSTVATAEKAAAKKALTKVGFNTASGKYCCN